MTARPPGRAEPENRGWSLRAVATPDLAWYRDLFRRIGGDWLWFSRLRMSDARLREIIQHPPVEIPALGAEGAGEGLPELAFPAAGECWRGFFGYTASMPGPAAGR